MGMGIVRGAALLVAVLAATLSLAACGPKSDTEAAPTFPARTASYKAVYETASARSGAPLAPVIYGAAGKQRIEIGIGGRQQVTLFDADARTGYAFPAGGGMGRN